MRYKRFDLIIDAFAKLKFPLKIVGDGPEFQNLKFKIACLPAGRPCLPVGKENSKLRNVELLPFVKNDEELRKLYNGAKALIFPQVEDFGLVAAEAQSCGVPIIAYQDGGALEIVQDGVSGVLFDKQTPECLMNAVQKFEQLELDRNKIAQLAKKFSKDRFVKELTGLINSFIIGSNVRPNDN